MPAARRISYLLILLAAHAVVVSGTQLLVPDTPPIASLIQVSAPDPSGMVTMTGAAGSVTPRSYLIAITLDTGHRVQTRADEAGAFRALLFAPAGTSILIKVDAPGKLLPSWSRISNDALAALPGTILRVAEPLGSGAGLRFSGAGVTYSGGGKTLPAWTLEGNLNKSSYRPGESISMTGRFSIVSASLQSAGSIALRSALSVVRISGPDGTEASSRNFYASTFLTPTGLPIEMGPASLEPQIRQDLPKVAADRAEATVALSWVLSADALPGLYRPYVSFVFEGLPPDQSASAAVTTRLDSGNRLPLSGQNLPISMFLPIIRVGDPSPPRLLTLLLADTSSQGARGIRAVEDRQHFDLSSRIVTQSDTFIVPRLDPRSGQGIRYRLEPYAPLVSTGDRGDLPNAPAIPFKFPSGSLQVRMIKPDGSILTIGPAPLVQSRSFGLVNAFGTMFDRGGGHVTDAYQLSTMDPSFEVLFERDGLHQVALAGSVDDIWGNTWEIRGSYEIFVARRLLLDTAVVPGTPFEIGDSFNPGVTLNPGVPANVEVRFQLAVNSDRSRIVSRIWDGQASAFGYFQPPGNALRLDQPGEYRVDVTASFRDSQGVLWMGSRTWGSVVASSEPQLIAHGRRGVDDQTTSPQPWFFRSQTGVPVGESHSHMPFHSGDVMWLQKSDAVVTTLSFQDPTGEVLALMKNRCCPPLAGPVLPQYTSFDLRAAIGESQLFSSRPGAMDPNLDPSKVDLWVYGYRAVERPLVSVRELIGEEQIWGSYWRFESQYGGQVGVGMTGDLPNDFKFQYGAVVVRGAALRQPRYAIYGSLFVLVPDIDPGGGTRTFPPFQGNGGGPSGGPILKLKGRDIEIFFHPTGIRAGSILEVGDVASFSGQVAPTLPSRVEIVVTSPGGRSRTVAGQANRIGYFFSPSSDFAVDEAGPWRVTVKVWHEGLTSAGLLQPPFPTGDVLGSNGGEFLFYVVEKGKAQPRVNIPPTSFARPAEKAINISMEAFTSLSDVRLYATVVMPGFILEETSGRALTYLYDAVRLNRDFPNLDLFEDQRGMLAAVPREMIPTGADPITFSFLVSGTDANGKQVYQARQVALHGEELLALTPLSRRRP